MKKYIDKSLKEEEERSTPGENKPDGNEQDPRNPEIN